MPRIIKQLKCLLGHIYCHAGITINDGELGKLFGLKPKEMLYCDNCGKTIII